jgi:hypothetical protein
VNAKERKTLQEMYRSLEQLTGNIRREATLMIGGPSLAECEQAARGAERARVLVYTWLREANMIPKGGR